MEKTITRDVKITKTIHAQEGRVEYNVQANMDPDEMIGILTRILASVQAGEIQPNKKSIKKETYIG